MNEPLDNEYRAQLKRLSKENRILFENKCNEIDEILEGSDREFGKIADALDSANLDALWVYAGRVWVDMTGQLSQELLLGIKSRSLPPWVEKGIRDWYSEQSIFTSEAADSQLNPTSKYGDFLMPDRYCVIDLLSSTKMARVWLVKDKRLERNVVLKAASSEVLKYPAAMTEFSKEAKKAIGCQLTSIVQIFDAGESNGVPYFVMEFMNKGSLQERISGGPLVPIQAVKYISVVARALEKIHQVGMIHRDIKPQNILFSSNSEQEEQIKLADFGLALPVIDPLCTSDPNRFCTLAGTPGYIAPELIDSLVWGEADPTAKEMGIKSDVYSLGATLYFCLTGNLPYQNLDKSVCSRIDNYAPLVTDLTKASEFNSRVDTTLDTICHRSLRKSPNARYQDMTEFALSLESWLEQNKLVFAPSDNKRPAQQPSKGSIPTKRSQLYWQYGLALLFFILPVFFMYMSGRFPQKERNQIPKERRHLFSASTSDPNIETNIETDPFLKVLQQNGWTLEQATQINNLNTPWFSAIDEDLAEKQRNLIKNVKAEYCNMLEIEDSPEYVSLFTNVITPSEKRGVSKAVDLIRLSNRSNELQAFFVRNPLDRNISKVSNLVNYNSKFLEAIYRRRLFGAEHFLLSTSNTSTPSHNVNSFSDQFLDICEVGDYQLANVYLSFLIFDRLEGTGRLQLEDGEEQWHSLLRVINSEPNSKQQIILAKQLLAIGDVWDLLEKPNGEQLLKKYGAISLALFSGPRSYKKQYHSKIRELLDARIPIVLDVLLSSWRKDPDFLALLSMKIRSDILIKAICIASVEQTKEKIKDKFATFSSLTPYDLSSEIEDVKVRGLTEPVPLSIYSDVTSRALRTGRIPPRKLTHLTQRAVRDVAQSVIWYFGAGPAFSRGFDAGFWAIVNANERADIRKLKAAISNSREELNEEKKQILKGRARAELASSEKFISIFNLVTTLAQRNKGSVEIEITPLISFFEGVSDISDDSQSIDWNAAKILEFPDRRQLPSFRTDTSYAQAHPLIVDFFVQRETLLIDCFTRKANGYSTPDLERRISKASKEICSAWWLLAASNHLPLKNSQD